MQFLKPPNAARFAAVVLSLMLSQYALGDLVGYWPLDGDANDLSQNAINGTPVGEVEFSDDVPELLGDGQSIHLNPEGVFDPLEPGYVDLGNPDVLNFGQNDWTISAWMKVNDFGLGVRGNIFSNGGDNSGGVRYVLAYLENGGQAIVLTTDDNTDKFQAQASANDFIVDDEEWHHIVGQREGTELRIYIDTELAAENLDLPAGYDLSGTSQLPAYIGVGADSASGDFEKSFQGWIDDVAVWNEALSLEQILSVRSGDFSEWLNAGVEGDYNDNGELDAGDLDLQAVAIDDGLDPPEFDLTGDGSVNGDDRIFWLHDLKVTWVGDADLNGLFDSGDFVAVFIEGLYETGEAAGWARRLERGSGIRLGRFRGGVYRRWLRDRRIPGCGASGSGTEQPGAGAAEFCRPGGLGSREKKRGRSSFVKKSCVPIATTFSRLILLHE